MRTRAQARNGWRLFAAATLITVAAFVVIFTGCATVSQSGYDGDLNIIGSPSDSVTYVPVTIENTRSHDVTDPVFYLDANGRHSLGRVADLSKKRVFVDSRWLRSPDGRITIVAHFVGVGDLTYEPFYWHPGEVIDVSLDTIFIRVAAWSHR